MSEWSISIVPVKNDPSGATAAFVPQLQPGGPTGLNVSQGDVVSWNNTTSAPHQPWPADSSYNPLSVTPSSPNYLSDVIPPGASSQPSWIAVVPAGTTTFPVTIYYVCKNDQKIRGVITVTN